MYRIFQSITSLSALTVKVKKVLVSQPKPASDKSPYYDIADKYGVEIEFRPFIKVEGLTAKEFRQSKISISDFSRSEEHTSELKSLREISYYVFCL